MAEPERTTPEEVHQKLKSGKALLVCAYDDEAKFKKVRLQGSISFNEFQSKLSSLSKDQEIVFYWAWSKERSAAGQAALYLEKGFHNVKCLAGRVEGWKKAGYSLVEAE